MTFKINLGTKEGKTYKMEVEAEELVGKEVGEKISGSVISPELHGYELEITGASDSSGFMAHKEVEGFNLNRILLTLGLGMHKKPRGLKKKNKRPSKGLKLRKTVRGKVISPNIIQVNAKVLKIGAKPLSEIFPPEVKSEAQ
ncbi:MAG: S6e family ribosomal protein [Nanoarchaeota archaeon]|nr:S6e family ribosomal protein [Nanoarchaeota archaeon]